MTNINQLNSQLAELAELENSLWKAFERAEKDYLPPLFRPLRLVRTTLELLQAKALPWKYNYAAYLLLTALFAVATVTLSFWFIVGYSVFLTLAIFTKDKYAEAFTRHRLGPTKVKGSAFGIDQPSLVVAGLIRLRETTDKKLDPASLQSILKIQKASGDLADSGFGVADKIKGALLGLPFVVAPWVYNNSDRTLQAWKSAYAAASNSWLLTLVFILPVLLILSFSFDLLFGQPLAKRRRKRYLLVLTLIAESYSTSRK